MILVPAASGDCAPLRQVLTGRAVGNVAPDKAVLFDQYYTVDHVAAYLYEVFKMYFDPKLYQMVEPTAGTGSFFKLLPPGSLAFDVDPKYPDIKRADFLSVKLNSERPIAIIGNPPFGKNSSMAKAMFNHAASQSTVVAFILPRTFRKASSINQLDHRFHLIREELVPANAFLFKGKPYNVPAVFQIWQCQAGERALLPTEKTHPDFQFTTRTRAQFAIQRVGAQAGRVHHDFTRSDSSTYFISGDVEAIMRQLDFKTAAANVAGNPSLSKAEVVALYRAWMSSRS